MITSTNLLTLGIPDINAYYDVILTNFTDSAVRIAKQRFEQLSKAQRKGFFTYLADEHNLSSDDPMYKFFFEIL